MGFNSGFKGLKILRNVKVIRQTQDFAPSKFH